MVTMFEEALQYAEDRRKHFFRLGDREACLFWQGKCEEYLKGLDDERQRAILFTTRKAS